MAFKIFESEFLNSKNSGVYLIELTKFRIKEGDINHISPYSQNEWNIAYNNKYGIQKALNYARDNGYSKVVFPKGTYLYCYEEKDSSVDVYWKYKPTGITIPSNMKIDMNGAKIKVLYDSINTNPFDKSIHNSENPIYKLPGHVFEFNNTCNSVLENGELIGDIYERNFSDMENNMLTSEKGCEQTYGVLFKNQSNFNTIRNMKIHGFMGDAMSLQLGFRIQEEVGDFVKGYINKTNQTDLSKKYKGVYHSKIISLNKFTNGYISTTGAKSTRIAELYDKNMEIIWYDEKYNEILRESYIFKQYKTTPINAKYIRFQVFGERDDSEVLSRVQMYISNMSHHVVVEGNEIFNNHRGGISNMPDFSIIRGNDIYQNGEGSKFGIPEFPNATRYQINFEDYCTSEAIIENNKIRDGFHGILISGVNVKIKGNTFENLAYGNTYYYTYNCLCHNNIFTNCNYTFELGNSDKIGYRTIKFSDNIINGAGYILLRKQDDKSNIDIYNNTISGFKWYAEIDSPLAKISFYNNKNIQTSGRTDSYRLVKQYLNCNFAFGNYIDIGSNIDNGDYSLNFNPKYASEYNYIVNTSGSEKNIFLHYNNKKIIVSDFTIIMNFRPESKNNTELTISDSIFNNCTMKHSDYIQENTYFSVSFNRCVFNCNINNILLDIIGYKNYNESFVKSKVVTFKNCEFNLNTDKEIFQFNNSECDILTVNLLNCTIRNNGRRNNIFKVLNLDGVINWNTENCIFEGVLNNL